jgi:ATP-dependent RNA helicase DDX51/DBP6
VASRIQVFEEFQKYAPAVGLRVGLATGQRDFAHEQQELTGRRASHPLLPTHPPAPPWGRAAAAIGGNSDLSGGSGVDLGGCVDVVVCTPGRLVDHLERTPGMTLEHLRFLVVDECDRLLNQTYNAWVEKVK